MKKITTTDQLKLVFQHVLNSSADDWKRTSKGQDAKGQPVRNFKNTKTGETVKVTETGDGQFSITGKNVNANVSLPVQFRKAVVNGTSQSIEDQIMDLLIEGKKDPSEAMLKKADPVKLVGKLSFSVIDEPDMGGVMAIVTPKGYDSDYSKKAYVIMEFLFPKAEYIDDSVYGMWQLDEKHNRAQLGAALAKAGLEWEEDNKQEVLAVKAPQKSGKPKHG
jgi:hypothetical protein